MRDLIGEIKDKLSSALTGPTSAAPETPSPAAPKAPPAAKPASSASARPTASATPPKETPPAGNKSSSSQKQLHDDTSDSSKVKVEDERSLAVEGGLEFTGTVLTSEDGALKIPTESRNLCVLFDNGMWLVSASHRLSPLVTSVAQMARRHGYKINPPRYVTPNIVRAAYLYADRQNAVMRLDDNTVRRRIVETLQKAANAGANDIHIEASEGRTRIEFRIDGALRLWETWTQKEGELMLASVYSHSVGQSGATANWQEPQAAMLTSTATGPDTLALPKGVISVRCQWVPLSDGGRYLNMRLQYDSAHLFGENFIMADVDSLGFSQEQLKVVKSLRQAPGGMRIFAGPVNQGKTTTLRVTLNRRMAETNMQLNCLLVEDPPEGGIVGARQVGVSSSVKDEQREKSFVEIMRCMLRLDPDIVMLGEVRDIQTAQFAFRLALTGRQVYTTTHVYSALAVPQRLRDIGMEPYLVYDYHLVRGMFCQRLLRGMCSYCRIPLAQVADEYGPLYSDLMSRIRCGLALMDASRSVGTGSPLDRLSEPDLSNIYFANPEGCKHCFKGRVGRTICAEVIETDQRIMELLQDNRMEDAREYWLSPTGMNGVTMLWHALEKIRRGEVSPDDAEFEVGYLASEKDIVEIEKRLGETA
ncbi:MAG: Flp pilus assembly complex ATPase component TadA [Alphaproteobacteria bacterium]|nr:Flp pilus assembly complex ATPase component TadA [Alphaproteobacteria bacterium]